MTFVLDASVAAKWFAPDGDSGDGHAERILRDVAAHPGRYVVPELFFHELLTVLCRRMGQARDVARAFDRISRLGLRRIRLDDHLMKRTARLAFDRRLGGYDACYAALAAELGGVWLTFDERAHARLQGLRVSAIPGSD